MSSEFFEAPDIGFLGERLPNYEFEGFIAQGGMGAVYKARQISLERDVAIKVLPHALGEDADFRESFAKEAKSMARLNHPNLIGVFDSGDVDGMLYIVMEYVEGSSLHESAWNMAVAPSQAATIVKGICSGLAHAHEHGIIHRDIKPSNILLTTKAEPKIGDFGLAQSIGSDLQGIVMGTPGYTAPEIFDNPDQAGPLADIYSVGVVLHQLLTGIDPAGNEGAPTQASGNILLDAIWRKATKVNPAMRYQSVAEMGADLQNWLDHRTHAPRASHTAGAIPPGYRPPGRGAPVVVRNGESDGMGLFFKVAAVVVLVAAVWFIHGQLQRKKDPVTNRPTSAGAEILPTTPSPAHPGEVLASTTNPDPAANPEQVPSPPDTVDSTPSELDPLQVAAEDDPVDGGMPSGPNDPIPPENPVTETTNELLPGDPSLQERAIGLILEARKKRDALLLQNAKTLQVFLKDRVRAAELAEAELLGRIADTCDSGWLPEPDSLPELSPAVLTVYQRSHTEQVSIESAHLAELNRIRDFYVPKLRKAAEETFDQKIKQRLTAQADSASDVEAWVAKLAPEPARQTTTIKSANRGFVGHWNVASNDLTQWVADENGLVTINDGPWKGKTASWKLMPDGSVEVHWPDKPRPYIFNPDGKGGWTGKTSFGVPVTAVPGDW